MNRFIQFTIPTALLLFFGSCSVQDHLPPDSTQRCKVVEEVLQSNNSFGPESIDIDGNKVNIGVYGHYFYEYDDQGRISKFTSAPVENSLINFYTDRYEYLPNQLNKYRTFLPGGTSEFKIPLPLNEQGTIISNNDYKHEYNTEGFLVKTTYPYQSLSDWRMYDDGVDEYTVENGNIVKLKITRPGYDFIETTLYEYDLSKPNLPSRFGANGKASKNLLIRETTYWGIDKSKGYREFESRYLFDGNGQVTRQIILDYSYNEKGENRSRNSIRVIDYSITCK
ncbi:hypothetical protein [Larkinella rosea]|uniref:DUF4595 domain-containing protein n=1 Tax=Larkinella rosea TaxID=2025312 RepID=A0A3P1C3Z8_9BACT|nr:hypothetical protein [Larkinella rosea]RRB07853.1 hypothetical protein EHT25_08775 [Larkinella rosea]